MTYSERISTLLESVEKKPRKFQPRYRKPQAVRDLEKREFEHKYKNSTFPEYARIRPIHNDSTANGLTKAVISYIKINGGQAYRINSQGQYDAKLKKWRYSGMRKGLPDIQAVINGQFFGIEIKIGKDRQSQHQKLVQSEIEKSGGIYYLAKDFESFKDWFDNILIEKNMKEQTAFNHYE